MAKISKYPEDTAPNPNKFLLVEGLARDGKYKTKVGNLTALAFHNRMNPVCIEFDVDTFAQIAPMDVVAMGAGTFLDIPDESEHPGIWRVTSGAAANTGSNVTLNGASAVLIGGGEEAEFIVRFPTTTNLVARLGFHDALTTTAPVDAVMLAVAGTTVTGSCRANNVQSNTTTTYTTSANTWYRMKIVVNSDATRVDFYIYDMAGTLLWTNNVTTNIPAAAGRETGFTAQAYKTTITAASLMDLDWMAYRNEKVLTR